MARIRMRDGRLLHVRTIGRGAPVLMVHGFGADSRSWLPFVAPLAYRYRFIMPDLRGFGGSHTLPFRHACALTQFAEDLEDVLTAERIDKLPVVGISMGALTTLQTFELFGGTHFSRYLHVDQGPVIHNGPDYAYGLLGPAQPAFFARLTALLEALSGEHMQRAYDDLPHTLRMEFWQLFGQFAAAAFTSPRMHSLLAEASQHESVMRRILSVERWQAYIDIIRAYLERKYDLRETFRRIRVPVRVLIGGGSQMYPPEGQRRIAHYAPYAQFRELPGVGHNVPYETPRAFFRELSSFLAET